MRRGGGVGYDFSAIRPQGRARCAARRAARAGRCRTCACSTRAARRSNRPARAAARRWASCAAIIPTSRSSSTPRTTASCSNFNVSVAVTDAFMRAVERDGDWELVHKRACRAAELARAEARQPARDDGHMGVPHGQGARSVAADHGLDLRSRRAGGDLSSIAPIDDNNLSYCEDDRGDAIPAANKRCPPTAAAAWAASTSRRFVRRTVQPEGALRLRCVRQASCARRCACSTTCSTPPSGRCRSSSARQRATSGASGLGFTGLGDALIMLGLRYDSDEARDMAARIAERMRDEAYAASVELAEEKGAFPLFDADALPRAAPHSPRACPSRSRARSASTACATATCCRSRRPAPSRSPSPTTPPTASSRPTPGPTSARSACRTTRCKTYDVEDHAWRLVPAPRRRRGEAAARSSSRRWRSPRSTTCAWSPRWRRSSIRRSARR